MAYIDVDLLRESILGWNPPLDNEQLRYMIDSIPIANVEEVVRCKDCKHYDYGRCSKISYIMDGYYQGSFEVKTPTDFCSYGERKDA